MAHFEIISLLLLGAAGWLWSDGMKAREAAILAVRRACEEEGLQLLDETIALVRMRLNRSERGTVAWARVYQFEFSDTGDNRRQGSVHLLGMRVTLMNVGLRLVASDGRLL
ncbi:MAG: DUF3301 domain-containing protein [Candidatus Methylumidiphilus sp.]